MISDDILFAVAGTLVLIAVDDLSHAEKQILEILVRNGWLRVQLNDDERVVKFGPKATEHVNKPNTCKEKPEGAPNKSTNEVFEIHVRFGTDNGKSWFPWFALTEGEWEAKDFESLPDGWEHNDVVVTIDSEEIQELLRPKRVKARASDV
jgi:hypothetical protein